MYLREAKKEVTTLHHFTKVENLISILESGEFHHSFCLEQTDFLSIKNDCLKEMAFAMVRFADVLKSERHRFKKQFKANSYIIMDKKWAVAKGVAPVMYSANSCVTALALSILLKEFAYMRQYDLKVLKKGFIKSFDAASSALNVMTGYAKKYQGNYFLERNIKDGSSIFTTSETQFFLEREWRHIPLVVNNDSFFINRENFKNIDYVEKEKRKLQKYALTFTKSDILGISVPKRFRLKVLKILKEKFNMSEDEVYSILI